MRRLGSLLGVLVLLVAPAASAQEDNDEQARHHFRLGQAHYESGHFLEAAHEFEESYRLSQRPALLQNIYVAYRDAGDLPRAADALRRYLDSTPQDENVPLLRRRLAALERSVADGGGEASSDADPSDAEGSGETDEGSAAASASSSGAPATSGGGTSPSPVGFIVTGVGAAMMLAGAITGGLALGAESELASNCPNGACPPGYAYEGRVSDLRALALTTDVLIPVGAAAAIAGVVLIFVLQDGPSESATASAACASDGCMAFVRGRY